MKKSKTYGTISQWVYLLPYQRWLIEKKNTLTSIWNNEKEQMEKEENK